MDKQKAVEAVERAMKDDDEPRAKEELWKAQRHLLSLSIMVDKEKDS